MDTYTRTLFSLSIALIHRFGLVKEFPCQVIISVDPGVQSTSEVSQA